MKKKNGIGELEKKGGNKKTFSLRPEKAGLRDSNDAGM